MAGDFAGVPGRRWNQERALRNDSLDQIRNARGPCPSDRDLQSYGERSLDADVSHELSLHIDVCGMCQAQLKRIADIDRALLDGNSDCPGWILAKRRLRKRIRDIASGKEP